VFDLGAAAEEIGIEEYVWTSSNDERCGRTAATSTRKAASTA